MKRYKRLLSITLALSFALACTGMVHAEENVPEDVNDLTYEQFIEIASRKPVVPDKAVDGVASRSIGSYPKRPGVILVTPDKFSGIIPLGHAGIVWSEVYTIEANQPGVDLQPNNWDSTKTKTYAVTTSVTTAMDDRVAADWCYMQRWKPYNYNFYDIETKNAFYCAQLVYAGFKNTKGIDLNTSMYDALGGRAIHPMELVDGPLTRIIYES